MNWQNVRDQFLLKPGVVFMDNMLLTSHPRTVREAISYFQSKFDESPGRYWSENIDKIESLVFNSAAEFLATDADSIALTDSATMGLGLAFMGFAFKAGDQILLSDAEHYSCHKGADYACERFGATKKIIRLYDQPALADANDMVRRLQQNITSATRMIAMTWVHSSTGVKLPIAEIGKMVAEENRLRPIDRQVRFLVDGVHGFGVEDFTVEEFNCDVFVTSCHKWLFGPRGTGLVWYHPRVFKEFQPLIPCYDMGYFDQWRRRVPHTPISFGRLMTPGGFHSFEYRLALPAAFSFQQQIGRKTLQDRTLQLAAILKAGLRDISGVRLMTPFDVGLSSALVCFEVAGCSVHQVIAQLKEKGIYSTITPYHCELARFSPAVYNTEAECEKAVAAVKALVR